MDKYKFIKQLRVFFLSIEFETMKLSSGHEGCSNGGGVWKHVAVEKLYQKHSVEKQ